MGLLMDILVIPCVLGAIIYICVEIRKAEKYYEDYTEAVEKLSQ